jgi:penicillin-binding protein 1A
MSKDEILFNYLNTVYFGSGAYGVGAAAISYFGKPVSQLDLSEAATLAGVIPAPTVWSPRDDIHIAEDRRELVLNEMLEQHLITQSQHDEAKARKLWLVTDGPAPGPATLIQPQPTKGASRYPYFVDWVEQTLVAKYGPEKVYRGGLRIETTIDPHLQELAEQDVASHLDGTEAPLDMALVSVEPSTGLVKAMVAGRDYSVSQVNLALGGTLGFQPGSSFKPFVLAAAFEQGIQPETVYPAPTRLRLPNCDGDDCYVYNVEGEGGGRETLRQATAQSVNTVFAQLIQDVGVGKTAEMASRLGVTSIKPDRTYGISLALGAYEVSPLDMAAAYGTFANQGVRQDPTPILRVFDKDGHLLEDNTKRPGTRVISVNVAANVTDLLTGVIKNGTGTGARIDRPAAGKTGTAEEERAAWFVGYTPQLSTAVWMGYTDGQRTIRVAGYGTVYGGTIPAPTWADFMRPALAGQPVVDFPAPTKLVAEPPPEQKPGAGFGASQESANTGPPDTTVKPGTQGNVISTPDDCGGPCQLYSGSVNLPLQISPTAAAPVTSAPPASPPSSAPPTAGATSPSGTNPPR